MFISHQRNNTFCFLFESRCAYKYCLTPTFALCFQHPTDVGDASTTVTTKPTDEQTNKPSDKPTDKPSDKPTVKQAEPPTSNYYFILIFMLCLMVQIRPSLQVHNRTLDTYMYIQLFSKTLQFENLY